MGRGTSHLLDAVVAGAGPAGARAARHLAAAGHRVLLLDAAPLGRDKPCGGGLTRRALAELDLDLDGVAHTPLQHAEIRCGAGTRLRLPLRGADVAMVQRRLFDRWLVQAASDCGAQVHDREAVRAVERDGGAWTVRTHARSYTARVVLIATGGECGALAAQAGIARPRAVMAPALEVEGLAHASRLDPQAFVFDYAVDGGYAWAFPKGETWNAGVLTTRSHPGPALRARLDRALDEWGLHFDAAGANTAGRRLPLWCGGGRTLHSGTAALLGDAAVLADPFFGEGIAAALLSGRLAAQAADDVLQGHADDLRAYSTAMHRATAAHLRRARLAAAVVYRRPREATRALRLLPPARAFAAALAAEPLRA